jgi:ferredoxin
MIINYGYKDGSGEYFIVLDTDKCNGCGECVEVCPAGVLEMTTEFDPDTMDDIVIPHLTKEHAKKIKYSCAPCKPGQDSSLHPGLRASGDDSLLVIEAIVIFFRSSETCFTLGWRRTSSATPSRKSKGSKRATGSCDATVPVASTLSILMDVLSF